jgi:hypothetical protein
MAILKEAGKIAEGAAASVGNTYQAFLYGQPMHIAQHGVYQPGWTADQEVTDPKTDDIPLGGQRSTSEYQPSLPQPEADASGPDMDADADMEPEIG